MSGAPSLVPALKDLCVKKVATQFQAHPTFGDLPINIAKRVTDALPVDLPFDLAVALVADEFYWKRRACSTWGTCDTSQYGSCWKQLFIERHLQEALERYQPATGDLTELRRLMHFSSRFVHSLRLRQLPSHLDLQILFQAMSSELASLSLAYNQGSVGMEYDRTMFGMKLADCRCLARALSSTETLVVLDLSNNNLDDDKLRMLSSGLADNISVTHLNLSHNNISDRGVRTLAKLLDADSVISLLDLSDNQVHADGGRALAHALHRSSALISLNLRLNRLGNEGCAAVCNALCNLPGSNNNVNGSSNTAKCVASIECLNLGSNGVSVAAVPSICSMMRSCTTLTELDITCNSMGEQMGPELLSALLTSTSLMAFDVRGCGLGADITGKVADVVLSRMEKRNRERTKKAVAVPGMAGTPAAGLRQAG